MFPLIAKAHHGGRQDDLALLDFSVNSNPLGPNPLLLQAWQQADLTEYPEPTYLQTRTALAHWHQVQPDQVVPGVGASELMYRICFALLKPGDGVLSIGSPFGEFARAVGLCRAKLTVTDRIHPQLKPVRLLYLSNPHNPSGHFVQDLQPLLEVAEHVLLDEAYLPFLGIHAEGLPDRVIRLQSPGKVHGLVGMRMAYALCSSEVAEKLINLQSSWHIPGSLDVVLRHLPEAQNFVERTLPEVRHSAQKLAAALKVPFCGVPFLLCPMPDTPRLVRFLLDRGMRVRDCSSYGYPDFIRVSTQLEKDVLLLEGIKTFYGS
ncbi:pyridoxal phosphate-dependent aminotransferase [Deinococcus cellulosilyticus]|uniref:histidinol-phosphate transaminase n=1 Tax=Deinococcus cellulosilyticus (strain DSM 18568 / NBRC 106333 / KACC 11606 / 5516J-15) TaxID=1223518 RepID=A0A511N9L0_DEIC1|nr:histidinol-phosphate transaminase [Deinococcus cellulosilyticus]GEM49515.1 histidinol-phosphate aminotransferase [Deinococcus cellulosilyticus NBRC 106333 = KACC 11606]